MLLALALAALGGIFIGLTVLALLLGQRLLSHSSRMVRLLPALAPALLALAFVVLAMLTWAMSLAGGLTARDRPVPCSRLTALRDLEGHMRNVTNPQTGQTLEYLVIGDGAKSDQMIVFF